MNRAEGSAGSRLQAVEATGRPEFSVSFSVGEESLRVLHVDDDTSFLSVSKMILEGENKFEIDSATSVDEAFEKLKVQSYDAIVSDFEMPQKNGLDFLKELREHR